MLESQSELFETSENPVVIEDMDAQRLDWNVGYFIELMDIKSVNLDVLVQRGYVWTDAKDSLLIRSILRRIPISNFYFNKVGRVHRVLEGKQRGSAIYRYVKGKYKLHSKTPPIRVNDEIFNIAGKTFSELPKALQSRITSYALDGHWFDNMSVDEEIEFFILTNSGKPVTSAEISRIRIRSRKIFLSLVEHPVLRTIISEKNRLKCKDEDIVAQLWCMCYSGITSLLQKDIGPILAATEVTEEQEKELTVVLDYLLELYREVGKNKRQSAKMRKTTHILSLGYMAFLAIRKNINKGEFIGKASALFSGEGQIVTINEEYNRAVGTGSANPEQMRVRMRELEKSLD